MVNWSTLLLDAGIDVPLERDQFNISSPFHIDDLPSCSINVTVGKWRCFAGCVLLDAVWCSNPFCLRK